VLVVQQASVGLAGGAGVVDDTSHPVAVAIHLSVDRTVESRRITKQVMTEAETIWRQYGIRLDWTDADPSDPSPPIALDVRIDSEPRAHEPIARRTVLGHVLVVPDTPARQSVHVSFDATESVLAHDPTGRSAVGGMVMDRELARALGRVLAHEIGHVLIGPPYHDAKGLMRIGFRADELSGLDSRPFRLTCSTVDRLRSRVRALIGRSRRWSEFDSARRTPCLDRR
jgi:hypothetical protein